MENKLQVRFSDKNNIFEDLSKKKGLENIFILFRETNFQLIKFLKSIKNYNFNTKNIENLVKNNQIISINNHFNDYGIFCSKFFINEIDNILNKIYFENYKKKIDEFIEEFCNKENVSNSVELDEIYKNLKDKDYFNYQIKVLEKENKNKKDSLNSKISELKEITVKYEEIRLNINKEFDNIDEILSKIDKNLKRFFKSSDILIGKENDFLLNFYNFRNNFLESYKYFTSHSDISKFNNFDLENLQIFIENKYDNINKRFQINYEEMIKNIKNKKEPNATEVNKDLCDKIQKLKDSISDQHKKIEDLKQEEKKLEIKFVDNENKNLKKISILSQKKYFEKFQEKILNQNNLLKMFLIFIIIAIIGLI